MAVDRQPGKVVYGLMDQSILDDMLAHPENMTYNEEFQGNMHIHDSTTALQKSDCVEFQHGRSDAMGIGAARQPAR